MHGLAIDDQVQPQGMARSSHRRQCPARRPTSPRSPAMACPLHLPRLIDIISGSGVMRTPLADMGLLEADQA